MSIVDRVIARSTSCYRRYVLRDAHSLVRHRWSRDRGDETLRLDYPLTASSIVFDIGGYRGDWAAKISERYNPHIFVFEPVPGFYLQLVDRFRDNPKVRAFNIGLADRDGTAPLTLDGDASGLARSRGQRIQVQLVDIGRFLTQEGVRGIDLVKLNAEGAEYCLLQRMLDTGAVERCRDIQVQFHRVDAHADELRERIRTALARTHALTYDYPFVWENWSRRQGERD